jgi:hypothetical protein
MSSTPAISGVTFGNPENNNPSATLAQSYDNIYL